MGATPTQLTVRVISCDAKIIGSLVGGCRVTVAHRDTGEVLAAGLHLGGAGDTESIMKQPSARFGGMFDTEGTAVFRAELLLEEPTPVEITVEGPLAYPQSLQKASLTTWLIPGQHVTGDGLVVKLYGFIVDILTPFDLGVAGLRSHSEVQLEAGVFLL